MFEPGDVVICVNSRLTEAHLRHGRTPTLREGAEYMVRRMKRLRGAMCAHCGDGEHEVVDISLEGAVTGYGYCPHRFRKKPPPAPQSVTRKAEELEPA